MTAARGRHAPPPEVRLPLQRERLLRAAAFEFAHRGYAGASSESISRAAGFSSSHDSFAVVGAIAELVSRQLRNGVPAEIAELAPVIERLIMALIPDAGR